MTLHLTEDTIDTEDVVEDIVEQDQGNVEFFLVEHAQSCLGVLPQQLAVNWDIILRCPVGVENGTAEGLVSVDGREVGHSGVVDVLVGPAAFLFRDETILEETQGFMGPHADETFH